MVQVLLLDDFGPTGVDLLKAQRGFVVEARAEKMTPEELVPVCQQIVCLGVRSATKVTASCLGSLLAIGRAGAGVDNIDWQAATQKGIVVFNTPGANSNAVAEKTIGDMVALARQTTQADLSIRQGKWEKKRFKGTELAGKTLGIVGYGNIGRLVAQKALGLKMKVVYFDPFVAINNGCGIERLTRLGDLLAQSDIITLHVPTSSENQNLICQATLQQTKKGVYILNHARGQLVNLDDMVAALQSGQVAGFATDVYPVEPPPEHEIFRLESNTLFSPHICASTDEAEEQCSLMIAKQFIDFITRGKVVNAVNFPTVDPDENLDFPGRFRLIIIHRDEKGALHHITGPLDQAGTNISDQMLRRKEKGGVVYNVIDTDEAVAGDVLDQIRHLPFVIALRQIVL